MRSGPETSIKYHQEGPDMEPTKKKTKRSSKEEWKRDLQTDTKMTGYTWRQIEIITQDRIFWETVVNGL